MKDFKEMAENRRSIKYFDSTKKLSDEILKKIIDLATYTPSCFNLQPWKVIVVKSEEARNRLYENACKQKCVLEAPMTLILIGDTHGFERKNKIWNEKIELGMSENKVENYIEHSEKILFSNANQKLQFAATNTSLFAMSLIYAANYYGVEAQPMIGFNEEITKMLYQIDDEKAVVLMLSLGYRDENKPLRIKERRLKYDEIVTEV